MHVNSKSSNLYVFDKTFSEDNAFFLSSPFHFIKSIFHANCFRSFLDLFLPDKGFVPLSLVSQSFDRHAIFQFNIIQSYFCPAKHFVLARQLEMGLSGGLS